MKNRIVLPLAVALATGATTVLAAGAASASSGGTCDTSPWSGDVQGRPATFTAHAMGGDYFWHARDGFNLRVTHRRGDRRVYTGSITASAPIVGVRRVLKERHDRVWLSADRKTLYFKFTNHGGIDGVIFHTACATSLTVANLKVGGKVLPASRVYLGRDGSHPTGIPFTVTRQA